MQEEALIDEIISDVKTIGMNIFVFFLGIILMSNPFLLSNFILFISVFALIKLSISLFVSYQESDNSNFDEIVDEEKKDEIHELNMRIKRLKKQNLHLKKESKKYEKKMKQESKEETKEESTQVIDNETKEEYNNDVEESKEEKNIKSTKSNESFSVLNEDDAEWINGEVQIIRK